MAIPPPPDESQVFGNAPPPPPPEDQVFGQPSAGKIPPPPPEEQVFKPGNKGNIFEQIGHDIHAGIQEGMTGGFPGFVSRELYVAGNKATREEVMAAQERMRQQAELERQTQGTGFKIPTPFGAVNPASFAGNVIGGAGPEMLVAPPGVGGVLENAGISGLKALGIKAGVGLAGHAAVGAGSDAAYQTADLLTGARKEYDTDEMLHSAEQMAAFGTAMAGAHAAPKAAGFVRDLFKDRGVDTTPSDLPAGVTRPLTGQGLSPEDTATYHDRLQNGSHEDITNFFKGRNIEPPSHVDINEWIQRRDAVNEGIAPPDYADEMFHPKPPDIRDVVAEHIDNITQDWKRKPEFEVINSTDDIQDPAIREQAKAQGADDPEAAGFIGSDGKVRIFANKLDPQNPAASLHAVLYHEALGHSGLSQIFGDRLNAILETLVQKNVGKFGILTKAKMADNPGMTRPLAAEETLAEMSEKGQLPNSIRDAVSAHLRRFGRKMGLDLGYNDAEIREILRAAHETVKDGSSSRVVLKNFQRSRPNGFFDPATQAPDVKFMFTGQKAANFDQRDPTAFRAPDGFVRNEVSDSESKLLRFPADGPQKMSDILKHDRLYAEYPQLADMTVHGGPYRAKMGLDGGYAPSLRSIVVDNTVHPDLIHGALLHEIQHAIQHIEGHSNGVKGDDADVYRRSLGEIEARSVEARKNIRQEDLAKTPAYRSQGVHRDEVIVTPPAKDSKLAANQAPGSTVDISAKPSEDVKFMRRKFAASKDYVADDLEGIYRSLDENYVPQVRTFKDVERDALAAGFKPSQIKDLSDVGDLATKLHRMQAAANMYDMKIQELNKILGTDDWNYGHQQEYLSALADRDAILQRIRGNKAEIARALNVSKMARSYTAATMEQVAEKLREQGSGLASLADDPVKFLKFAKEIKDLMENGNSAAARVKMEGVNKPYWEQYLNSFHFNAMLSALSTHVKAPVDMTTGILRNVFEKALAMPIGGIRRLAAAVMGKDSRAGVSPQEMWAHVYGLAQGVSKLEVYRQMAKAVKDGHGGYVGPDGQPVEINTIAQYGGIQNPDLGLLSLPSHLVAAQDTFFRSAEMSAQLYSYGMRKAIKELGSDAGWDALHQRAEYHAMHPDEETVALTQDLTNRTLLLNSNKLNRALDRLSAYKPDMSVGQRIVATVVKNIAPFIRVEANSLINRVIQRSPLAFLDPYTQGQLRMGGPEADLALARIAYGTVALGLAWAGADKLTGNVSDDPKKRAELLAGGVTPRSVHEGNRYDQSSNLAISVMPWDQHNATAQMVKGIKEAWEKGAKDKDLGTSVKLATYSIMHELADMTWISSIAPYVDAATSDEVKGPDKIARAAADQAKTFVPNILNQAERMTDTRRDTRPEQPGNLAQTVGNAVKSAVPGLAETLPTKYSVYGEPLPTGQTLEGVHTPIPGVVGNHTTEPTNPQIKELTRLAQLSPAAQVTPVMPNIRVNGVNIKLTPAQQEQYQSEAGKLIQYNVKTMQDSGQWKSMSDKDRIQYATQMQKEVKAVARQKLANDPDFFNDKQRALLGTNANAQ